MSSYNLVNGTYAHENRHLLTEILREEWGFDGVVISDWGGSNNPVAAIAAGAVETDQFSGVVHTIMPRRPERHTPGLSTKVRQP